MELKEKMTFYHRTHAPKVINKNMALAYTVNDDIVNMGVKNADGSVCCIIGVLNTIRNKLNKHDGGTIQVVIEAEE